MIVSKIKFNGIKDKWTIQTLDGKFIFMHMEELIERGLLEEREIVKAMADLINTQNDIALFGILGNFMFSMIGGKK